MRRRVLATLASVKPLYTMDKSLQTSLKALNTFNKTEDYKNLLSLAIEQKQLAPAMQVLLSMQLHSIPPETLDCLKLIEMNCRNGAYDEAICILEQWNQTRELIILNSTESFHFSEGAPLYEIIFDAISKDRKKMKNDGGMVAFTLLEEMLVKGVGVTSYNLHKVLFICSKGGFWIQGTSILKNMDIFCVKPTRLTYSLCLSSLTYHEDEDKSTDEATMKKKFEFTIDVLKNFENSNAGLPSLSQYTNVLYICLKQSKYDEGISIVSSMIAKKIVLDSLSFQYCIKLAFKTGAWKKAYVLLQSYIESNQIPSIENFDAVVNLLSKEHKWKLIDDSFQMAVQVGVDLKKCKFEKEEGSNHEYVTLDISAMSKECSLAAVRNCLQTMHSGYLLTRNVPEKLIIITVSKESKVLKKNKGWRRTDKLREFITEYLSSFSTPLVCVTRGPDVPDGSILVKKGNIQNFLEKVKKGNQNQELYSL